MAQLLAAARAVAAVPGGTVRAVPTFRVVLRRLWAGLWRRPGLEPARLVSLRPMIHDCLSDGSPTLWRTSGFVASRRGERGGTRVRDGEAARALPRPPCTVPFARRSPPSVPRDFSLHLGGGTFYMFQ